MDLVYLRNILRREILALKDAGTHEMLPNICENLGLPVPVDEGTKRERMSSSFDSLVDSELPKVAELFLKFHPPAPLLRNEIQDLLWIDLRSPEIPKKFRHELARELSPEDLYLDASRFDVLLERLWVIDDNPMSFFDNNDRSLRNEIERHVHRNPGDWSTEYLFDRLGAFDSTDRRFALFIEGLASADVIPDETAQRKFVAKVNTQLSKCGVELTESDIESGYPVFSLFSTRSTTSGRPKNIIFASDVKPDLRFRDALNNDVEIVTNADRVLVYDRPISKDGLLWNDLQTWWSDLTKVANDDDAKKSLYRRLLSSLPINSPPQKLFFESYYGAFGKAIPMLPALLPEVWLHWDHKTVRERGPDALLRYRMDFLLLLPVGVRVVVEVDGKQHYAFDDGRADCARYAKMTAADRELKLAGYEVFRFGADELQNDSALDAVSKFFEGMFKKYGVSVPVS